MLRTRQSRVEAAFFVGREDALAGDHECGCAQGNAASFRGVPNLSEGVENDFLEALIDLVLGPKIAGEVLHPLEIGTDKLTGFHATFSPTSPTGGVLGR